MSLQAGSREQEDPQRLPQAAGTGITAYLKHLWGLRASRYASRPASSPAPPPDGAPIPQPWSEQAFGPTERVVLDSEESLRSAVLAPGRGYCFEGRMFDCVVDTFGLCSCKDPVRALQEMLKVSSSPAPATAANTLHCSSLSEAWSLPGIETQGDSVTVAEGRAGTSSDPLVLLICTSLFRSESTG